MFVLVQLNNPSGPSVCLAELYHTCQQSVVLTTLFRAFMPSPFLSSFTKRLQRFVWGGLQSSENSERVGTFQFSGFPELRDNKNKNKLSICICEIQRHSLLFKRNTFRGNV